VRTAASGRPAAGRRRRASWSVRGARANPDAVTAASDTDPDVADRRPAPARAYSVGVPAAVPEVPPGAEPDAAVVAPADDGAPFDDRAAVERGAVGDGAACAAEAVDVRARTRRAHVGRQRAHRPGGIKRSVAADGAAVERGPVDRPATGAREAVDVGAR